MKYKEDYALQQERDATGKSRQTAVYIGDHYDIQLSEASYKQLKLWFGLLISVAIGVHLAAGFLFHSGSRLWFFTLPYIGAFLPLGLTGIALLKMPRQREMLERYQVDSSFNKAKLWALVGSILLGVGLLAAILYHLALKPGGQSQADWLYLLYEGIAEIMLISLFTKQKQVKIEKRVVNSNK